MAKLLFLILWGILLIVIGIGNLKGNVSSIHRRNRQRVSESDLPYYGKCIGSGTLLIGLSCLATGLLEALFKTDLFDYILLFGCLIGIAVMLYGQFKYNKGIF